MSGGILGIGGVGLEGRRVGEGGGRRRMTMMTGDVLVSIGENERMQVGGQEEAQVSAMGIREPQNARSWTRRDSDMQGDRW